VSYALHVADDARVDLNELDPLVQEVVLDELERLAQAPEVLHPDHAGIAIHDFDSMIEGVRHVFFLRLNRNDVKRLLSLMSIADVPGAISE
jgi:hypothetical protein